MNNSHGSFAHVAVNQKQNLKSKLSAREFIFQDIDSMGSFLFRDMKLELLANGNWCFQITAEGKSTTTLLRNGRKSGPLMLLAFSDVEGRLIQEVNLGQVNYGCTDDSADCFVCKGTIGSPENVETVSVRYEAFVDFACRRN